MRTQNKSIGIGVVGIFAAEPLFQKRANMNHVTGKTVRGKQLPDTRHAQRIPIIFIHRLLTVLGNLVHVEETDAQSPPRYSANLPDRH